MPRGRRVSPPRAGGRISTKTKGSQKLQEGPTINNRGDVDRPAKLGKAGKTAKSGTKGSLNKMSNNTSSKSRTKKENFKNQKEENIAEMQQEDEDVSEYFEYSPNGGRKFLRSSSRGCRREKKSSSNNDGGKKKSNKSNSNNTTDEDDDDGRALDKGGWRTPGVLDYRETIKVLWHYSSHLILAQRNRATCLHIL